MFRTCWLRNIFFLNNNKNRIEEGFEMYFLKQFQKKKIIKYANTKKIIRRDIFPFVFT